MCALGPLVEGGLTVCFEPFRSSEMNHSHFLVTGAYGNASLLGRSYVLFGVLMTSYILGMRAGLPPCHLTPVRTSGFLETDL